MKPRSTQLRHRAIRICAVPFAALFAVSASAADISWNGATNAVWSTGGNWVGGVATDVAVFNAGSTANLTTTLGADFSIQGLKITTPSGLITIGGANTLTLGAGGIGLNVALQDLQLNALVALAAEQSRNAMFDQILTTSAVIHGREVNLSKIEIADLTFSGPGMFTSVASTGDGQTNATGSLRATKVEKLAFADFGMFSIGAAPRVNRTVGELRVSDGSGMAGSANRGGKRTVKISSRGVGKAGAKEKTVTTDATAEDLRAALKLKDGTGLLVGDEGLTLNNTGSGNTDVAGEDVVTVSDANIVTDSNQNSGRQYVTSRLVPLVSPPLTGTWANVGTAWGTGTNWSGGTAPGTGDDALFNLASYTFQPAFTANAALGEFHSSGAGAITFTGTQTLTLNANGSTAGTGILVDSGAGAVNFAGVKFILGASQSWTNNSSNVVNNGGGTINTNGQTLTFDGSGSGGFNLNGVISSSGNLVMNQSSGTLTLNGANSFTGTTTITAGTLIVGSTSAGRLGGSAATYAGSITNNGAFIYKTNTSQTYSGLITGSGSLTKDTSSTFDSSQLSVLTLSNALNDYTGATTITAGTLSVSASGNLGGAAANLVFNGGTLQITGAALTNFSGIGHTVLFTSGKTVSLDINSNANTFTVDQVLNQGTGGFIKAGAGTVILNQANTYTGNTTVNAGVLQYASTSAISGSGRNVTVNPGGAVQFAAFSNADIATALGRIDTTSKGTVDPTNNLAGIFDFSSASLANTSLGAGGTTGLNVDFTGTLTPFGTTYRLGGTNSSANNIRMATANQLSGANDVVVTGGVAYLTNQSYSGTTFLNSGTLQLSGPDGAITSGAGGITFNGGALTLTNAVAENAVVRVPSGTAITSNGGTFNFNNASNATTVYAQTVGSVAITTGQLDTVLGTDMVGGGGNTQTLTLAGLTHATSATGTATFSATTTGPNATTNMINVTGGTASTNIGPWATVGTTAALQTDYAAYDGSKNIVAANVTASVESGWTSSSTLYTNGTGGNVTLGATAHDMLGLRNTGGTTVMKIQSGGDLHTYGLLNGVSTLWTIQQNAGAGVVTTPTGGGNLFVTTGAGAITISAPVTNSADVVPVAVSLVKSGSGTLTLSGPNTYTGGTFINAGTLTTSNATALGSNSAVTLANVAGATLNITAADISIGSLTGGGASGGNVTLGAKLTVGGDNTSPAAYAGSISGVNGSLTKIGSGTLTLSGNNTYGSGQTNTGVNNTDLKEGTVVIDSTNPFGNWIVALNTPGVTLQAATTARTVTNPIWLNGSTTTVSGSQSLTFSGNVMGRGGSATLTNNITGGGTLSLTGNVFTDVASGSQILTFNGTGNTNISAPIANNFNNFAGPNGSITMSGSGKLTLSGTNTYSGVTNVNSGTLQFGKLVSMSTGSVNVQTGATLAVNMGGTGEWTTGTSGNGTIGGLLLGVGGQGNAVTYTGNVTLGIDTTNASPATQTYVGAIGNVGTTLGLTKLGTNTLTLSNTNTYTGTTTVNGGTLQIGNNVSGNLAVASSVTVNNGGTLGINLATGATFANNVTDNSGGLVNTNIAVGTQTLSGIVSGAGALTQSGAGTTILSNTNTYSGATAVNAGKLSIASTGTINNTSGVSIGAAAFNYNSSTALSQPVSFSGTGGTLSGSGTITPAVTVSSGNTLSPGNGVGTLGMGGGLTIDDGGIFSWQNSTTNTLGTAGTDWSVANVTGGSTTIGSTPSIGSKLQLQFTNVGTDFANAFWNFTRTWDLIAGGVTSGNLFDTTNIAIFINGASVGIGNAITGEGAFTTVVNGSNEQLVWTAVGAPPTPEQTFVRVTPASSVNARPGTTLSLSGTLTNIGSGNLAVALTSTGTLSVTSLASDSSPVINGTPANVTGTINTGTTAGAQGWQVTNTDAAAATPTASISGTVNVYDLANANYTGTTLAFGNVHQGVGSVSQAVAIGNQEVTNASFQDLLDVSATTDNASVTATGFTDLAASANGLTTSNLTFAFNRATVGSLASTASLTLTSNANGVAGLSNGTATVVGGGTITTTGQVYSGLSTWTAASGGSWGTLASGFGVNWGTDQGSPGLDAGFTSVDTATFGSTAGSVTVNLDGASPSLKTITFNNTGSYTIAPGSGGGLTMRGSGASISSDGTQEISAPVTMANNLTASVNSGNLTISGAINGVSSVLTKNGAGTLTLSGINTYGSSLDNLGVPGTDLQAGTVVIDTTSPFGNWIVALNGNTLVLQAATTARTVANRIWLNGTTTTVSGSQSLTFSGSVMGRGGNATLSNNITGPATLSLTGNVYTDWAGGFQTLTFGGTGDTIISAVIADNVANAAGQNGKITKTGVGTLTLSNTNTYTGPTTVNAGTLQVNGSITSNTTVNDASLNVVGTVMGTVETNGISSIVVSGTISGTTTVNSGGTLGGSGGTLGNVLINGGGTLSPGVNDTSTLNTGTVTFNAGGIFKFEIDSTLTAIDQININGNLNIATGAVMNVSDLGSETLALETSAPIITYTGLWSGVAFDGMPDDSIFTVGLNAYQISYNGVSGTTNEVTLTVVPEPGVALSLFGGLGLLLSVRRRRA